MAQFFETIAGRQFYEGTLPRIARSLESISESLKVIADAEKARMAAGEEIEDGDA